MRLGSIGLMLLEIAAYAVTPAVTMAGGYAIAKHHSIDYKKRWQEANRLLQSNDSPEFRTPESQKVIQQLTEQLHKQQKVLQESGKWRPKSYTMEITYHQDRLMGWQVATFYAVRGTERIKLGTSDNMNIPHMFRKDKQRFTEIVKEMNSV